MKKHYPNRTHWPFKHGMYGTQFYTVFTNMKQRCENPNHKSFKDYGAKGIKVEWNDFIEFYNDMYQSYLAHVERFGKNETTIDRIDGRWNYNKENCKWSTHLEQSNNLSSNRMVVYKWKSYKTLASLCREYGIWVTTMNQRLNKYGRTLEEAIETPIQIHKRTTNV